MKNQIRSTFLVLSTFVALAASSGAYAQLGSDDCASPTPISGGGQFPYELGPATTSGQGYVAMCSPGQSFLSHDVWFCWTADCTGLVKLSTCGLTQADTVIAIYPDSNGCACPQDAVPLCCNDDACGKQSEVTCEVVCGRRYMIQVGTKLGAPGFSGEIRIDCQGQPCDNTGGGGVPATCVCCGERPELVNELAMPFDPGLVAAVTNYSADLAAPALYLVDLGNQGSAPIGSNWTTDRYAHPTWNMGNLGSIFGVTLDGVGNIFCAHTALYPDFTTTGELVGFGGVGAIYAINGATGAAQTVIALPQQIDPSQPINEQYPGVGQLSWDCDTARLYASNFEDGRIYSINPADVSGFKVRSTYRHLGAVTGQLPNGSLAIPGEPAGFEPLGSRIFAVKANAGRVYYSLWNCDMGRQTGIPNQIWSVAVNGTGDFVAGSAQLEITLSERQPGYGYSNPVADITFDSNCCMLVGERTMYNDTTTSAHASRVIRFCGNAAGAWGVDTQLFVGLWSGENSTGGVAYETGGNDMVWSMTDAMSYPTPAIYGLQGQASAGAPLAGSLQVDLDGNIATPQKQQLGSLEVNCLGVGSPCEFTTEDIDCVPTDADGGMNFLWTVNITNNSTVPANLLILPDAAFAPNNVIVLTPPLAPGSSLLIDIPIIGGTPGSTFCFSATLASSGKDECCTEEVCIELPDCTCFDYDLFTQDVTGANNFTFSLSMINLSDAPVFVGEWLTIAVAPGYAATVNPSLLNLPSLPWGMGLSTLPITVNSALPPGSTIVLIVGLHSQSFHPCCFKEITITVPAIGGVSVPGDIDGDGMVNGLDLAILLSNWGDGKESGGASDLNDDGVTDAADLTILLSNWS